MPRIWHQPSARGRGWCRWRGRDGGPAGRTAQPPRAADHGRRLPARAGDRGRGPGRAARPAQQDRRPHPAAHPRREGPPHAPAGGAGLRLPAPPPARAGGPLGVAPRAADLFRRLAGEGGRRPPRRRGLRPVPWRARAPGRVDPPGSQERKVTMSDLPPALLDAALKGTALLAVAGLLALALRRASAATRHLLWALALAGLLALPVLSLLLPRWQLP